jgi:hypothetical protein
MVAVNKFHGTLFTSLTGGGCRSFGTVLNSNSIGATSVTASPEIGLHQFLDSSGCLPKAYLYS